MRIDPRALLLAAGAGLAGTLAHPPVAAWPLAFVVPALLLGALALEAIAAEEAGRRANAVTIGTVTGLVMFGPMLWWLQVLPGGPMAWVLLAGVQALFVGLVAALVAPFIRRPAVVLALPVAWLGVDAWRAIFPLGGFEWGALAYAHAEGSWLLPLARVTGGRGLTLVTVLVGALAYEAARRTLPARGAGARVVLRRALPALVGIVVTLAVASAVRVGPPAPHATLDVLAVQGNDFEHGRGDLAESHAITQQMLELTRVAIARGGVPDLTVWPESSVDRDPRSPHGQDLAPLVREAARLADGGLVAGMSLEGPDPATTRENAMVAVAADGRFLDRYLKRQLVPFGEYVPWRGVLGWLPPLQHVPRDTIPGDGPHALRVAGVPVAVAICYETLFAEVTRSNVRAADAGLILAVTNNASYGRGPMPFQHLAQSRLRAVETGRWVVHVGLSGTSAFVAPDGSVSQVTGLYTQETIRADVAVVGGNTPFLAAGDVLGLLARGAVLVLGLVVAVGRRRRTRAAAVEESAFPEKERQRP